MLEVIGLAAIPAILMATLILSRVQKKDEQIDASWRAAADRLDGWFRLSRFFRRRSILLERDGLRVRAATRRPWAGARSRIGTRVTVTGTRITVTETPLHRIPRSVFPLYLSLRRHRSSVEEVPRIAIGPDIAVGDERFDTAVDVRGERTSVLAVLDDETRARVLVRVGLEGGVVENDEVRWEGDEVVDGQRLEEIVRDLLALVTGLRDPRAEIPARLARNAAEDPVAGVRVANLRALQRESAEFALARSVSQAALEDEAPAVRLAAAQFLGKEGVQTLRDLVESGPLIDAGVRLDALRLLVRRAPRETVLPLLDRILDDLPNPEQGRTVIDGRVVEGPQLLVWRQAASACGALQHAGATARLIAALGRLDPPSANVVAEALGAIGDPAAEPALIGILGSEDTDAAVAAAHALGRIGSAAAVEPLLARVDGALTDRILRDVAREAVEAIQARLRGAEAGQLGLAEAANMQGQLAISDPSQDGRVSLRDPRRPEGESEPE
jgi:HEAT repeat protein